MDEAITQAVRRRAGDACEYCRMPQAFREARFPIDHIIARKHRGSTAIENLALCCVACNRYKGPNIAGIDPLSGRIAVLFHPRRDRWDDHFVWDGPELVGRTPEGRATIEVLRINHPNYVAVRKGLMAERAFPSSGR